MVRSWLFLLFLVQMTRSAGLPKAESARLHVRGGVNTILPTGDPSKDLSNDEPQIPLGKIDESSFGEDIVVDGNHAINRKTGERFHIRKVYPKGVRDSHGHTPHDHALTVLGMLFICMIGAQYLLSIWKKRWHRSFQLTTLVGLWIIPFFFAVRPFFIRFILVWTIFSLITICVIRIASRKPLSKKTPRQVYRWFHVLYHGCYAFAICGYVLLLLQLFGVSNFLFIEISSLSFLLLFYGLYFGVLSRDCAEMCADRMASSMGYSSGRHGLPSAALQKNICSVCNEALLVSVRGDQNPSQNEKIFTLNCDHQFHEFCIRGWTMIGKKDTCPRCSEKVSLRQTFKNPWDNYGIAWAYTLNILRYLIVWNPVILWGTQFLLTVMGYGSDDEMPEAKHVLVPIH